MKKMIAAAAAALIAISITACSDNKKTPAAAVSSNAGNGTGVTACGLNIAVPEDWEALTGDKIYEELFSNSSEGFETAEELKSSYSDIGMSYVLYAVSPDRTAALTLTALEITRGENTGEQLTLEEYARTNHNNSIFSFQASGYSLRDTVFAEESLGSATGWLSACEVYPDQDSEELLMGQSEFTFEYDGYFCSLQGYYHSAEAGQQLSELLEGIS